MATVTKGVATAATEARRVFRLTFVDDAENRGEPARRRPDISASHAQLPHSGIVKDQPKQLSTMPRETKTSSISRGHT
jgi:hypothetical protein